MITTNLIIIVILSFSIMLLMIIMNIIFGLKEIHEAKEREKAKKCPYFINKEERNEKDKSSQENHDFNSDWTW